MVSQLFEHWVLSINGIWDKVVVVGYGSIGKRHVTTLIGKAENVWVVDPRDVSHEVPPNVTSIKSLADVNFAPDGRCLAVVANWGPDHLATIEDLAKKGFSNIILEKPMVTSLRALVRLTEFKSKYDLTIMVNQGWHFSDFYDAISEAEKQNQMGSPVAIWSVGGARCLSTTGSHVIHMATRIFKSKSIEYTATLRMEKINPRAGHLEYVEGVASIRYSGGQRLSLSYTNSSAIEGSTFIYWRNFCAEVDATGAFKITTNINSYGPGRPVTRYSPGNEIIFDSNLEPTLYKIDNMDSLHENALHKLTASPDFGFNSHRESSFDMLMLLNSSIEKRSLVREDARLQRILERNFMVS